MTPKIKIVVKEVGKKRLIKEITSDLKILQEIVGGHLEMVRIAEGVAMIVNEEGKLEGLTPNFVAPFDIIVGNVLFIAYDEHGNNVSLTLEQINIIDNMFEDGTYRDVCPR